LTDPLRKEREEITTADIAQQNRPGHSLAEADEMDEIDEGRPKPVQSDRTAAISTAQQGTSSPVQGNTSSQGQTTPLFPNNELQDLRTNWDSREGDKTVRLFYGLARLVDKSGLNRSWAKTSASRFIVFTNCTTGSRSSCSR
jgi:hypothetical protein